MFVSQDYLRTEAVEEWGRVFESHWNEGGGTIIISAAAVVGWLVAASSCSPSSAAAAVWYLLELMIANRTWWAEAELSAGGLILVV